MKKLIGLGVLLLTVACQRKVAVSSPAPSSPAAAPAVGVVGGSTPAEAVSMMLTAGKAEDLQAVGAVWGDIDGLAREKMPRSDFEMRVFYLSKCLRNDKFQILSEGPGPNASRAAKVRVSKGPESALTTFTMVTGKNGRWFVKNVELEPLTRICQMA